jgi:hypothetical protein
MTCYVRRIIGVFTLLSLGLGCQMVDHRSTEEIEVRAEVPSTIQTGVRTLAVGSVTNRGSDVVTLGTPTSCLFDVEVLTFDGTRVFGPGRPCFTAFTSHSVGPGETVNDTIRLVLPQNVAPGAYVLHVTPQVISLNGVETRPTDEGWTFLLTSVVKQIVVK